MAIINQGVFGGIILILYLVMSQSNNYKDKQTVHACVVVDIILNLS